MFCVNCGKPYSAADRFCNSCGHQIPSATIQENSIAQSVITLQSLASTVPQASAAAVALAPEPEIALPATVSPDAPSYAIFASRARIPSELEEGGAGSAML
jgi:hypothetical protein